ncbi:hypothetical protein Slu03_27830 [Sediminihabitans luteus]|nr:hypothetical protein Slu03_27830 [Sediminihabitans luteus]
MDDVAFVRVRRAEPHDLPAVRTVLAAALATDPMMRWVFPGDEPRPDAVAAWLAPAVEGYVLAGSAYVAETFGTAEGDGPRVVGAAAWQVPTPTTAGPLPAYLPGARVLLAELVGAEHADAVLTGIASTRSQRPEAPHPYLHLLGVDAGARRRGVATELVQAGLAELAPDGHAVVETMAEANLGFYERLGFVRRAHGSLGAGAPDKHTLERLQG